MMQRISVRFFVLLLVAFSSNILSGYAQSATPAHGTAGSFPTEGYLFEDNNRGYLAQAEVTFTDESGKTEQVFTEDNGKFIATLYPDHTYKVKCRKKPFYDLDSTVVTIGHKPADPLYLKYAMKRLPGYIFEAAMYEKNLNTGLEGGTGVGVDSVHVEIYNHTTKKEVLNIETTPTYLFSYVFEQGNEYSLMLRHKGYFNKRMHANINIHGCILCFEGLGSVTPGVVDNLTERNSAGTLAANVQLQRIEVGRSLRIDNIYYDVASAVIRSDAAKELDKLVNILRDNPQLSIELSSHTDSRGSAESNLDLSERRAQAAVAYIASKGIQKERLSAKGYGETKLVNGCADGVQCTDEQHQRNRRTEFQVMEVAADDPYAIKTLAEIIEEQEFMKAVLSGDNETIAIPTDGSMPALSERKAEAAVVPQHNAFPTAPPAASDTVVTYAYPDSVGIEKPTTTPTVIKRAPSSKKGGQGGSRKPHQAPNSESDDAAAPQSFARPATTTATYDDDAANLSASTDNNDLSAIIRPTTLPKRVTLSWSEVDTTAPRTRKYKGDNTSRIAAANTPTKNNETKVTTAETPEPTNNRANLVLAISPVKITASGNITTTSTDASHSEGRATRKGSGVTVPITNTSYSPQSSYNNGNSNSNTTHANSRRATVTPPPPSPGFREVDDRSNSVVKHVGEGDKEGSSYQPDLEEARRESERARRKSQYRDTAEVRIPTAGGHPTTLGIKPESIAPALLFPPDYTGFRVEVLSTPEWLSSTDDILVRFERVYFEVTPDGRHHYLIGDYKTREKALEAAKALLGRNYEEARIFAYSHGIRN